MRMLQKRWATALSAYMTSECIAFHNVSTWSALRTLPEESLPPSRAHLACMQVWHAHAQH